MNQLRFIAYGVPQPKGSARAFVPKGWTRPIITSTNAKNKGWQQLVAEAASAAIAADDGFKVIESAAALSVTFHLPRPKSIRDRITDHIKKPDLDKLIRSVKDALTQVAWQDDSLVIEIQARKRYAEPGDTPRADICISEIGRSLL